MKNFLMWMGGWGVRRRSPGCHSASPPLDNAKPWPGLDTPCTDVCCRAAAGGGRAKKVLWAKEPSLVSGSERFGHRVGPQSDKSPTNWSYSET